MFGILWDQSWGAKWDFHCIHLSLKKRCLCHRVILMPAEFSLESFLKSVSVSGGVSPSSSSLVSLIDVTLVFYSICLYSALTSDT